MLELIQYSSLLFLFFCLLLIPLGHLSVKRIFPELIDGLALLAGIGVSALFYAALTLVLLFCGISKVVVSSILLSIIVIAFAAWNIRGHYRIIFSKKYLPGCLIAFCYYLFVVFSAAFPEGKIEHVSPQTAQIISGYAIDNLISYNLARYLLEDISINAIEVVPTWSATERGPLAGVLTALCFLIFGVRESSHWLLPNAKLFFLYQCLLSFLNLLSLFAVWTIARDWGGRKAAAYAALLLCTMFFFFINSLYTWPKFFMTFYLLTAFALWRATGLARGRSVLIGVFLGGALLTHNISVFYVAAFFGWLSLIAIKHALSLNYFGAVKLDERFDALKNCALTALSVLVLFSPWVVFQILHNASARRLLYMHAFCIKDRDIENLTLGTAVARYFREHGVLEFFQVRFANLLYPFDLGVSWPLIKGHLGDLPLIAHATAQFAYYQLLFAAGPLVFVLGVLALIVKPGRYLSSVKPLAAMCFLGMVPVIAAFGCPQTTWNHSWAYPVLLAVVLLAAGAAARKSAAISVLLVLALTLNLASFACNLWFRPEASVFLHASSSFLMMQAALFACLLLLIGVSICGSCSEEGAIG